jgi:hypothetical protein
MYTDKELETLMASVEKQFSAELTKAFAKSEDFPPKKDESKEKDEKKASAESQGESSKKIESEKPEDKGVKDQSQQDNSKDDKGQPMESKEGRENADAKENAAPSEDPHGQAEDHGYDDEDMQHMHSMYSSMSKPELKAHHDVIRKCMDGMGLAKCEDGITKSEQGDAAKDAEGYRPNGGPKDGESAKCKTPASSDAQALNKSETNIVIEDVSLIKSELESVKAENEKGKKELEAVTAFLTKFVAKTVPAGKAITSLDVIAKTEGANQEKPLSKSEIDAKLLVKAKDQSLSKSDREAINSYYFNKDVKKVSHLLK